MVIDSHCHLHDRAFADLGETLRLSLTHDVWGAVAVGCDAETNAQTLAAAAAARNRSGRAWVFIPTGPVSRTKTSIASRRQGPPPTTRGIVGVGEIGLPWYSLEGAPDAAAIMARGRERLDRLLGLASRWDLPVALHAPHGAAVHCPPGAEAPPHRAAVFHWHKAPVEVTHAIVDAGYFVSSPPTSSIANATARWSRGCARRPAGRERRAVEVWGGEFEGIESGPWLASRVAEEVAKLKRLPVDEMMFSSRRTRADSSTSSGFDSGTLASSSIFPNPVASGPQHEGEDAPGRGAVGRRRTVEASGS